MAKVLEPARQSSGGVLSARATQLRALGVTVLEADGAAYGGALSASAAPTGTPVVQPKTLAQIKALINWARKQHVSLASVSSSAGDRRRGVDAGRADVIVDLSQMKRIFHIDAQDLVAIIEPGLTFTELDAALAPHGLRCFKPLLPRRGKSVLASYLEREPHLNVKEQWDVLDPLGAGEMVFGTGETFRTGSAATPGTMEQHLERGLRYLTAAGPVATDFMRVMQGSQGTLGVLAWAAVFCERIPTLQCSYFVGADTLEPLLRISSQLNYRRFGGAQFMVNRRQLAMMMTANQQAAEALLATLPAWILFVDLYSSSDFPAEQLAYESADLNALANAEGLQVVTRLAGIEANEVMALQANPPEQDYRARHAPAYREVFFIHELTGAPQFVALAGRDFDVNQIGVYVQPRLQGRNCHIEFTLPFATAQEAANANPRINRFAQDCCNAGGLFSRPYGVWSAMAFARNPGIVPFMQHTKNLFDPDGILSPGRLCF